MFRLIRSGLFGKNVSKKTAKNRLEMVLVQDRSGLSSNDMESFQKDLIEVITKYFTLERKSLEIDWKRDGGSTALVINTPVHGRPQSVDKGKRKKKAA